MPVGSVQPGYFPTIDEGDGGGGDGVGTNNGQTETGEVSISDAGLQWLTFAGNFVREGLNQVFDALEKIDPIVWDVLSYKPTEPQTNDGAAEQLLGLEVGSSRTDDVSALQEILFRQGYLSRDAINTGQGVFGTTYTQPALIQFQRDHNIPESELGFVGPETAALLENPGYRVGYAGAGTEEEPFYPSNDFFSTIYQVAGDSLGEPISPVLERDGYIIQHFENGSIAMSADGSNVRVLNRKGQDMFPPITEDSYNALYNEAATHHLNQFQGDSDGRNQNCGFASIFMSLSFLGVPNYRVGQPAADASETDAANVYQANYNTTIDLRELGGDTRDDDRLSSEYPYLDQAVRNIDGVSVSYFGTTGNTDGSHMADVERMRAIFMFSDERVAFVVGGNPTDGWGTNTDLAASYSSGEIYDGSHFVAVVGYNPATDKFLVLDPATTEPIEVSSAELANYMNDGGVSQNDVMMLTYSDPANTEG